MSDQEPLPLPESESEEREPAETEPEDDIPFDEGRWGGVPPEILEMIRYHHGVAVQAGVDYRKERAAEKAAQVKKGRAPAAE